MELYGEEEELITQDKVEHWAFGFIFTFFALIHPIFIFTGYGFTVAKELDDWSNGRFDAHDMLAGFVGAGMAFILLSWLGIFRWGMLV